jgi:hypothetical protein
MIATKPAFYRGRYLKPGDSFEAHEGFGGSWAVPKGSYKPEVKDEAKLVAELKEAVQGRAAPSLPKKKRGKAKAPK